MAKRRSAAELATEAEARLRLERARLATKITKARSAALATYKAATKDRTNKDWAAKNVSADLAILPDKVTLDARARQMVRDDAYAASIVKAFTRNVVGTGINPSPAARDPKTGKAIEDFNKSMADAWWDWASRAELVDIEGRRDWRGILRWAISELITVGEAFIIESYRERDNGMGLTLQCVESEQLDRYKTSHTEGKITRQVRGGVEVDDFGKAVAYWVYPTHPNDAIGMARPSPMMLQSIRIPADRVRHVVDPERARQTRGISRLAPVLDRLRNLADYDYRQLLAARAEASIGLIIESDPADESSIGMAGAEVEDTTDADGNDLLNMQPIMVARLAPGQKATGFDPKRPGGNYEPFVKVQLRGVAAAVGISYEQVARDMSNGSYSAQRQTMLEDRREFMPLIELLICSLCQPTYEAAVEWSIAEGRVKAAGYWRDPRVYDYAEWRGQGWAWIDPQKQAYQAEMELKLGLRTKRDILLEMGYDWREVARQRAEEVAFEKEVGAPTPMTTGEVSPVQPAETDPVDPNTAPAADAPAAPEGDESGIVATEDRISSIDAERANNMLGQVSRGEASPDVVKTLLIGMGFTDTQAAEMVNAADTFEPTAPAIDPAAQPAPLEPQPAGATDDE